MRITKDGCSPGALSKTRDKITSETARGFVPAVLPVGAGHGSSYSEHEVVAEEGYSVRVDSGVLGEVHSDEEGVD